MLLSAYRPGIVLSLLTDSKPCGSIIRKRKCFTLSCPGRQTVINTFHEKTILLSRIMAFLTLRAVQQQKELP